MRLKEGYEVNVAWSDADGCYVALVPKLPFVGGHGDTEEEALANAREAIVTTVEVTRELGKELQP